MSPSGPVPVSGKVSGEAFSVTGLRSPISPARRPYRDTGTGPGQNLTKGRHVLREGACMGSGSEEACRIGSEDEDSGGDGPDTSESVLWMPERNEEDTGWVRPKDKEVSSAQNKVKTDPLATVKQRKDLLVKTLVRQDNFGRQMATGAGKRLHTGQMCRILQRQGQVLLQAAVVPTGRAFRQERERCI